MKQEMMGGSGISWTICKSFAPRFRQITTPVPHHSVFTGWMPFLPPNQQFQSIDGTHTHNRFTALWNLSGTTRVSRYEKKHLPTTLIMVINHPFLLSPSTTTHGILRIQSTCSTVFFHNLSKFSLVYLLAWVAQISHNKL